MTDHSGPDPEVVRKLRNRYKPVRSNLWVTIEEFPNYQICEDGRIRNRESLRELPTSDGVRWVVSLRRDGKLYRRGVRGLYLRAYGRDISEFRAEN